MSVGMVHDGESYAEAKVRFWYGLRHPWTRNPAARNRYGWYDFIAGHSTTNLYVSWTRENGRDAGHLIRYLVWAVLAEASVIAALVFLRK